MRSRFSLRRVFGAAALLVLCPWAYTPAAAAAPEVSACAFATVGNNDQNYCNFNTLAAAPGAPDPVRVQGEAYAGPLPIPGSAGVVQTYGRATSQFGSLSAVVYGFHSNLVQTPNHHSLAVAAFSDLIGFWNPVTGGLTPVQLNATVTLRFSLSGAASPSNTTTVGQLGASVGDVRASASYYPYSDAAAPGVIELSFRIADVGTSNVPLNLSLFANNSFTGDASFSAQLVGVALPAGVAISSRSGELVLDAVTGQYAYKAVTAVPEPAAASMLLWGLLALAWRWHRCLRCFSSPTGP